MGLYRTLTTLGVPFINRALARRVATGKEIDERLDERRGIAAIDRATGPLVWIHGASLGEAMSVLALIDALLARNPRLFVLVTTGTVTSAQVLSDRLPKRAAHQFAPVDHTPWVRRFLDHWRPDLTIWIESEIWPALVSESAARAQPMVVLNGRMSPRSTRRWRWGGTATRRLFAGFTAVVAQNETAAAQFRALGANPVTIGGNLKLAAPALPVNEADLIMARNAIGARPVLLAASTHPGEEERLAVLHQTLAQRHPGLLTILAPRHPARGPDIRVALAQAGHNAGLRSQGDAIGAHDIYVTDTLGELGLFYRLAQVAIIGGTLTPIGGHNPLEAARLDCAILLGCHSERQHDIVTRLVAAGGALQAMNDETLMQAADRLLSDPVARSHMATQAAAVADDAGRALDQALAALDPYLCPLDQPAAGPDPSHAHT